MIIVRPEEVNDYVEIEKVRAAAITTLRETYRPGKHALENKIQLRAHLQGLVAVSDDCVVGTVQYYFQDQSLKIIGLGVHPDFRRRGVARNLVSYLAEIGKTKNVNDLKLHTIKETGNVEVFKRLGFIVAVERKDVLMESSKFEELTDVEMVRELPACGIK